MTVQMPSRAILRRTEKTRIFYTFMTPSEITAFIRQFWKLPPVSEGRFSFAKLSEIFYCAARVDEPSTAALSGTREASCNVNARQPPEPRYPLLFGAREDSWLMFSDCRFYDTLYAVMPRISSCVIPWFTRVDLLSVNWLVDWWVLFLQG